MPSPRSKSYDQAEMSIVMSQMPASSRVTSVKTPSSVVHVEVNHRRAQSLSRDASFEIETIDEVREFPPETTSSEAVVSPSNSHILQRRHSSNESSYRNASDLDMLLQTLELRRRQLGPRHHKVGEVYNLIGNIYFRYRNYEKAIEAYSGTLLCDKSANDPSDVTPIAAASGNLGTVYWTIGDMDKSLEYLECAMSVHVFIVQAQGKDPMASLNVAGCLYQIGIAECLCKNYRSALENLTLCLEIQERVLGLIHVDVARTADAIGKAYFGVGDYEQAMNHHMDALVMKKQWNAYHDSTDDSGMLISLQNIAAVHWAREEYNEAISMYQKVVLAQKSELARLKKEQHGLATPAVVRLAMEAGDTLLTLKGLYWLKGETAASTIQGKEAALFYKEAGLKDNDTRMVSCRTRGAGLWNSV